MALYVSIDEGYSVRKLSNLKSVVRECEGYTLQNGKPVTLASAKNQLKMGSFDVYEYDEYELKEAKQNGSVRGIDWILKIQSI